MHPALSIIFFTTASGLGYGLAAFLGLGVLDPAVISTKFAHFLALALISAGLLASTLHLANPQRAWRALSQWRSSWLSREGVMAILTFVPLCIAAWAAIFMDAYVPFAGLAGTLLALVTVYCTSMIYASLKSVQAWHTPLTPAVYLLFSAAGGAQLCLVFAVIGANSLTIWVAIGALMLLALAWGVKWRWRMRLLKMNPLSTTATATGLGGIGRVKLFESPHGNDNYLTREMGFQVARKHAAKLARISFATGGILPGLLILTAIGIGIESGAAIFFVIFAAIFHIVGVLVERWLFFAEARHAVMNYYGR